MKDEIKDLRSRTTDFALRIIKLYCALPKHIEAQVLGRQLLRLGTSVGAHYRESCRVKSDPDFISKIEEGLQELEETSYWLELLWKSKIIEEKKLQSLIGETVELLSIFVSVAKKVKKKT
jgi:four helix bundle protein